MYNLILTLVIILSVLIVITVMMQPSNKTVQQVPSLAVQINYLGSKKRAVLKLLCNAQQQFLAQFG